MIRLPRLDPIANDNRPADLDVTAITLMIFGPGLYIAAAGVALWLVRVW